MKYKPGDIVTRPDAPTEYLMISRLKDPYVLLPEAYYVMYRLAAKFNNAPFLTSTIKKESVDKNYIFITDVFRLEGY